MLVSTFSTLREIGIDLKYDHPYSYINNELNQAVLSTIAYFDIFDLPLTDWEVYKYLWKRNLKKEVGFLDVKCVLENNTSQFSNKEGFYFLKNREDLVEIRKQRQIIASQKYKKARRIIKLLSILPYIKMIAVTNSLAYDNAKLASDIDLFIVASENKIWTARFYANFLLKVLHLRPTAKSKQDKICLNIFVTADNLDLQHLMIENDIYFIYWLVKLVPIYDQEGIFKKLTAENKWLNHFILGAPDHFCHSGQSASWRRIKNNLVRRSTKFVLEIINKFSFVEQTFKKLQLRMMPADLKNNANKRIKENIEVVINDKMLKFHHGSKKEEFRDEWKHKIVKLLALPKL